MRGRVIYIESVDPDGDGDLHVVLAGGAGVTGPGVSSVDVEREFRPKVDPHYGDVVTAAGQVVHGSYGQGQIQAVDLHFSR